MEGGKLRTGVDMARTRSYKRVYFEKVKQFLLKHKLSVPIVIGIFYYLVFVNAIVVTNHSGDMTCAGTPEDPCYAYIDFCALKNVYIYPNESWEYFSTEPAAKRVIMQRKWGDTWRTINLSKSWSKRVKYAVKFSAGKCYSLRFVGYKYHPWDNVKWSFGDIDPWWNSSYSYRRAIYGQTTSGTVTTYVLINDSYVEINGFEQIIWCNLTVNDTNTTIGYLYYNSETDYACVDANNENQVSMEVDEGNETDYGEKDPSIVRWYHMGTTEDSSVYGNDGSLSGTVNVIENGKIGKSYNFTTSDAKMSSTNYPDISEGTILMWFKPAETISSSTSGTAIRRLFYTSAGLRMECLFNCQENDVEGGCADQNGLLDCAKIYEYSPSSHTWHHTSTNTNQWNAGEWYFLAFTWSDSNNETRIYINGYLENNATWDVQEADLDSSGATVYLAGRPSADGFRGDVDEFRMYNKTLTADEILAIYNNTIGTHQFTTLGNEEVGGVLSVTLNSPEDGYTTTNLTVNFQYTPVGQEIQNCSLWTNVTGSWEKTKDNESDIVSGEINTITYTFSDSGTVLWSIECWNTTSSVFANENRTVNLNASLILYLYAPKESYYYYKYVWINGSTNVNATIKYSLDSGANQTICDSCTSFNHEITITENGGHNITIYANTSVDSTSQTVNFFVDTSWYDSDYTYRIPVYTRANDNLTTLVLVNNSYVEINSQKQVIWCNFSVSNVFNISGYVYYNDNDIICVDQKTNTAVLTDVDEGYSDDYLQHEDDLLLLLHMNDTTDSSSYNRTISVSGTVTATTGKIGGSQSFSGGDSGPYLYSTDYPDISEGTILMWFSPSETISSATSGTAIRRLFYTNSGYRIECLFNCNDNNETGSCANQDGKLDCAKVCDGAWFHTTTNINQWNASEWYLLAFVFDDNNDYTKIYINGVLENEVSGRNVCPANLGSTSANVYIGGRPDTYNDFYGKIDEVRFYNRTLSAEEILAVYNNTVGSHNFSTTNGVQLYSTTAPVITITSPQNNGVYEETNITFSFYVTDNNQTIHVKAYDDGSLIYDNESYINGTVVTFYLNKTVGSHNVSVWANDTDGEISEKTHYYTIENNITITLTDALTVSKTSTQATIRQISPSGFEINITASLGLDGYLIYIQNIEPDNTNVTVSGATSYSLTRSNEFELLINITSDADTTVEIDISRMIMPLKMCFGVTGDNRPDGGGSSVDPDWIEVVKELKASGNSIYFTPMLGDIVGGGYAFTSTPEVTDTYHNNLWESLKHNGTFIGVIGNHDMSRGSNQGAAETVWMNAWKYLNYTFLWNDSYYFMVVDTYRDDGSAPNSGSGEGFLLESNWNWFVDELTNNNDKTLFAMFHQPVYKSDGSCGWQSADNCADMRDALESNETFLVMGGHYHYYNTQTHNSTHYLIEGRSGAELGGGESYHGFTVVCLNGSGGIDYYKINTNDGQDISVSYSGSNDYSETSLNATITNNHGFDFPVNVKFLLQGGDYNISVSGADYYYTYSNEFGKVVIATKIVSSSSSETISVEEQDTTPPDITWNEPENNSFTNNVTWIYWNVSVSETPNSCILEINQTTNYTMNIDGLYCYYNLTGLVNATTYCGKVYANDSVGNMNVSDVRCATVNLTSYETGAGANFSIWNGTNWVPYDKTQTMQFYCEENAQNCEPNNQDASASQCITRVCNNGSASGDVYMKLNATCSGMTFKVDDDFTPVDAVNLTTTYQLVHTNLGVDECVQVCWWLDLNNPETPCLLEPYAKVE